VALGGGWVEDGHVGNRKAITHGITQAVYHCFPAQAPGPKAALEKRSKIMSHLTPVDLSSAVSTRPGIRKGSTNESGAKRRCRLPDQANDRDFGGGAEGRAKLSQYIIAQRREGSDVSPLKR
jgi:hypothetical protein